MRAHWLSLHEKKTSIAYTLIVFKFRMRIVFVGLVSIVDVSNGYRRLSLRLEPSTEEVYRTENQRTNSQNREHSIYNIQMKKDRLLLVVFYKLPAKLHSN